MRFRFDPGKSKRLKDIPSEASALRKIDAEKIARMAEQGQDISGHFRNQFTVVRPAVQRVNVDFTAAMLRELDREAEKLNISR